MQDMATCLAARQEIQMALELDLTCMHQHLRHQLTAEEPAYAHDNQRFCSSEGCIAENICWADSAQ